MGKPLKSRILTYEVKSHEQTINHNLEISSMFDTGSMPCSNFGWLSGDVAVSSKMNWDRVRKESLSGFHAEVTQHEQHPKQPKTVVTTTKRGKISRVTVTVPCECVRCQSLRKRAWLARNHMGPGKPYSYAILRDGRIVTFEQAPAEHPKKWDSREKRFVPCDCYNCTNELQ
jgi:hypothetical protein